jgi:endonuclease/exonuclease/phosphatase family metal-dependent hydrolase
MQQRAGIGAYALSRLTSKPGPARWNDGAVAEVVGPVGDRGIRVATLNLFGLRANWNERRTVVKSGLADLNPDLMSFQEVITTADYDQVRDVLRDDYHVAHHRTRLADGQGDSIASRWPIMAVRELDVPSRDQPIPISSALIAKIEVPRPVGPVLFVNHPTAFELTHEAQREWQACVVADFLERDVTAQPVHVVVAGDFNATPDSASVRFWTGKQSLDGRSVCYRDAWSARNPDEPGHTFTPDNTLTTTAEGGEWELELGRRIDYVLVRCTEHGPTLHVTDCRRIFDGPVDGVWASDHFGVTADLSASTPMGRLAP